MARFMAIFTDKPGAMRPDAATMARGMQAWGEWMARYADQIVDAGGPLGPTKHVSAAGIADVRNSLAVYIIVEADDHAAAARMFERHPHFDIFSGDGIEVMPCLPMPVA